MEKISNQGENTKTGSQMFEIKNGLMYLNADFDEKPMIWMFDTGVTVATLFNSEQLNAYELKKIPFGKTKAADGTMIETKILSGDLENGFMSISQKLFAVIPTMSFNKNDNCEIVDKTDVAGFIGMDVFYDNDSYVEINFESNHIAVLSQSDFEELSQQFRPLDAEIKDGHIFLRTKINGKAHKLLLDTGFNGDIIFPYKKAKKMNLDKSEQYEGLLFRNAANIDRYGSLIQSADNKLEFGEFNFDVDILFVESINSSNLGLGFIKNFNWLIDYKNEKVYAQLISNSFSNKLQEKPYKVLATEGELRFVKRKTDETEYGLNDVVLSVNSVKITPENICRFQKMLNESNNWDNLQIEIKK
ncbi:MAG: hypothetical protein WBF83_01770 [Moheibacter sp.]